ncbi:hypothetical protein DSM25559_5276 [Agrobacterium rosae]|uniref:Uncharacterized protein n=1 Tax=Agrobacterium rosae TaxID=1972867 RepID=A0A1R3UA45_9HYPH|nr:hypothetical protein DSM25559_5276 [Agrobacterium rosae]
MSWETISAFLTNNQLVNIPKGLLLALIGACLTAYFWLTADDPNAKFLSGIPPVFVIVGLCIALVSWIGILHSKRTAKAKAALLKESKIAQYDAPALSNMGALSDRNAITTLLYLIQNDRQRFMQSGISGGAYHLLERNIIQHSNVVDGVMSQGTYVVNRNVWAHRAEFVSLHANIQLVSGIDYSSANHRRGV